MRVSLLTYSTRPRGGVVHTLALAEALAGRGHEVTVWSIARGGDTSFFRPVDDAVRLSLVPFAEVEGEGVGPRILRSIDVLAGALSREDGPDSIAHAQDCITANAALAAGLPVLRTVHHLDRFTTVELAACHEKAIVAPSALVCVSAAVAREVREGWGRDATVIPNGVDAGRFEAAASLDDPAATAARALWRERFGRYVLAVGGIEPRKGTMDLIEAFALVRRVLPEVRLVVAGGETLFDYRPYRARVDARAAQLGVTLEVLGAVAHDTLPALVAGASAFAFPSTQEGFGLAAMEALAARVPVVARDLPVLREVFGGSVRFFDGSTEALSGAFAGALAGALVAALGAGENDFAAPGRALAARHTWDAAAVAHEELYCRYLG